jgi:hypothetical protein
MAGLDDWACPDVWCIDVMTPRSDFRRMRLWF